MTPKTKQKLADLIEKTRHFIDIEDFQYKALFKKHINRFYAKEMDRPEFEELWKELIAINQEKDAN